MKCPFRTETVYNEDNLPSNVRTADCDEGCMLRVMTGDGEFQCAFQCAQNSLHMIDGHLERVARALENPAGAGQARGLEHTAERLFGEACGLMRALHDEDAEDAWRHAKEVYDLADRILDAVRDGGMKGDAHEQAD